MPRSRTRRFSLFFHASGAGTGTLVAFSIALGGLFLACGKGESEKADDPATRPRPAPAPRPGAELEVPSNYHGPVDPMWPPSHPADLEVELAAARLIREKMEEGVEVNLLEEVNLEAGDHADLFVTDGRIDEFDYLEVIFGNVTHPDERLPLVVILHGRGGRAQIPAGTIHFEPPIRLFIPRGPDRLGDGFHWLATYTRSQNEELLVRSLAPRADQVAKAIATFARLRPTKGKPVLVGFSQGAILTYGIYARHPEIIHAAFPIAGWLSPQMDPETTNPEAYPILQALHGGSDNVVPTELDRQTVERLASRGFRAALEIAPGVGHEVTLAMNGMVRDWIAGVLEPEKHSVKWVPQRGLVTKPQ